NAEVDRRDHEGRIFPRGQRDGARQDLPAAERAVRAGEKGDRSRRLGGRGRRHPATRGGNPFAALVQPAGLKRRAGAAAYLLPLPRAAGGAMQGIGRDADRDTAKPEEPAPTGMPPTIESTDSELEPAAPNTNVTGGQRSASATTR